MWESTGLYGESALCRYQLGAPQVEQRAALAAELFGEGICRFDDVIWQLTWQDRVALRWDARTLELIDQVPITGRAGVSAPRTDTSSLATEAANLSGVNPGPWTRKG